MCALAATGSIKIAWQFPVYRSSSAEITNSSLESLLELTKIINHCRAEVAILLLSGGLWIQTWLIKPYLLWYDLEMHVLELTLKFTNGWMAFRWTLRIIKYILIKFQNWAFALGRAFFNHIEFFTLKVTLLIQLVLLLMNFAFLDCSVRKLLMLATYVSVNTKYLQYLQTRFRQ